MDLSITQVPSWISILFILSFITVPVYLIANTARSACRNANNENGSIIRKKIIFFYWSYLAIVALVSLSGFFSKNTIPPRIILATVVPLLLFYLFYVQRTDWFHVVFKHITLEQLVFIHLFRFVGFFFFFLYYYDVLPQSFAFIGGSGDILTAVLVFPVVKALRRKLSYARSLVLIWNIIGLVDIISVLITAIVSTRIAMEHNVMGVEQFGTFPFSWIPSFAPATIVFLHILIFKKLKEEKNKVI